MSVRFRAVMFCFVVSVLLSTGVGGLVRFVSDSVCGVSGVENVLSSLDELVNDGDVVSFIIVKSGVSFADLVLIVVRFVGSVGPGTCFPNALAVASLFVRAVVDVVVMVVLSVWLE